MGKLFSPTKQKTSSTSDPWGPQADALKGVFTDARGVYDAQKGTAAYQGNTYANMDPLTGQGIDATRAYATGAGADAAAGVGRSAAGLFGSGQTASGAYDRLQQMAGQDSTQGNIDNAGLYANNPHMDGMIDAASRDVSRNLYENQIPGLNMGASGSGNINSSRAGVAEGVMRRGAADSVADISSNLRGSAYQSGLQLSQQARQAQMDGMATAGAGYSNLFGQGMGAAAQGQDMAYRNTGALVNAGELNQQDAQGRLDATRRQWEANDTRQTDILNRYYGIIGANNWGGKTTGVQPGQSIGGQLVGAGAAIGGAFMASDERLKHNVELVGTEADGLNRYDFDYRQDNNDLNLPTERQRFGVMAQEVAVLRPHALAPTVDGFLHVNYGAL